MDEVLLANFDVFLDAVNRTPYDLWIGDEAWDVDHYLHENPELKRAPYVFMTDFLGWLPIDRSEGSREAWLTADYNRQMIGQVERYRRVRDLALYIGDYDDLIPECFGPGLPSIPEWTREHFTATGYVLPFDPQDIPTRSELGYAPDRPLVIFTVGGTSVGRSLLKQVIAGWPLVLDALPDAQGLVVAGPRMNPETFEAQPNLAVTGYVHNLHRHLSVADVAVVQGGLSTTMELTAARRPFIYVPLRDHFEQLFHVSHRLSRYQAGLRMEYDDLTPESLAAGILSLHGSDTACYRQIEPGAARRAAEQIAPLL